ncbi:CAP domain-containing protein, partial [Ascoidea rubescens DSM 1968]
STSSPSSSSTSVETPVETLKSYLSELLNNHNAKRALHGVSDLVWDEEVYQYAKSFADAYSCPADGMLSHSDGSYGENLAAGFSSAASVVDAWYEEIQYYNFNNPGFSMATGHFTQLVWASTDKLGCAYKDCNTIYGRYVVCNYSPPGNVIGHFAANV